MTSVRFNLEPEVANIVERTLLARFGARCTLSGGQVRCISEGLGAVCRVLQVHLNWIRECADEDLPETVLFKIPRLDDESELVSRFGKILQSGKSKRSVKDFLKSFNDKEAEAYSLFMSAVDRPIPVPVCYYSSKISSQFGGMLVLEDLSGTATLIGDISMGMSMAQMDDVCKELAHLHAWCWITNTPWHDRFPRISGNRPSPEDADHFVHVGLEKLRALCLNRSDDIDDQLIMDYQFKYWPEVVAKVRAQIPDILKHGDLWTNNILFYRNADGQAGDKVAAFIDWQLCEVGAPLEDICHLLIWSTSTAFRRQHQRMVLKRYHEELCQQMEGKAKVPDFSVFWSSYKAMFPFWAFLLAYLFHGLVGTVIKCGGNNPNGRLEKMINRTLAAYHDATEYLKENNQLLPKLR